jgi:nucleoside-diphosphate-sugar epimerase
MRVFVTGSTGFVGSAVVQELLGAGHQVLGLVRSDASAKALTATGAEVHQGSLEDLDSLRSGAARSDGVIHTAFIHDFSKFKENSEIDERAITALGDVLAGSDRPLIVTSGMGFLAPGRVATEQMVAPSSSPSPRVSEQVAERLAARGVRASAIRLPPSVHGDGDHGFVPILIGIAREKGASAYIGDGLNRWPAVHRLDVAQLYRLVLESGSAEARYHGSAEEGVAFRDIAGVIGRHLNLPVVAKSRDEAADHFGWFANFAAMDTPASSAWTQQQLGWQPTRPGLISDLDHIRYFGGTIQTTGALARIGAAWGVNRNNLS